MLRDLVLKAKQSSLSEIRKRVRQGTTRRARHGVQSLHSYLLAFSPPGAPTEVLHEIGSSDEEIIETIRGRLQTCFFLSWEERDAFTDSLKRTMPDGLPGEITEDADRILGHRFDILGSGEKMLGERIDWRADLKTGIRWPTYKSSELPLMIGPGDILRVWELSRFQWGPTLGKAYWLRRNECHVDAFLHDVEHWCRKNPPGFGPNWISSQDVALRAMNWILSLCFMGDSTRIPSGAWLRLIGALYLHGTFIETHLDLNYLGTVRTTGTHYLSGLLGLLYLGLLFQDSEKGRTWIKTSRSEILSEMDYQVHPDGCDYESSLACYHRFALEHFLYAYLLFRLNDMEVPASFVVRLEKMFEVIHAYTRPDGTVPQIGDAADCRVHILSSFASWKKDDHRSLLKIGAGIFGRRDFEEMGARVPEDAFWLLGRLTRSNLLPIKSNARENLGADRSVAFPHSGFYFMKNRHSLLALSANPVGMKGKGNHKHNDVFSFDLFAKGTSFIVDPGSYVYTSDLEQRHLFRSTRYHNTFQINDYEQNAIDPQTPWRVKEEANPRVIQWETTDEYDLFRGEHAGYGRFIAGLVVERTILFDKKKLAWIIQDGIKGHEKLSRGTMLGCRFHLNTLPCRAVQGAEAIRPPDGAAYEHFGFSTVPVSLEPCVDVLAGETSIRIHSARENKLKMRIERGWVCRQYGIKQPAPIVTFEGPYVGQENLTFFIETSDNRDGSCVELQGSST